jgi:CYRIA/CYRIB Rac1 binding domain
MVGGGGQTFTTLGIFIDFENIQPSSEEQEIYDAVGQGMNRKKKKKMRKKKTTKKKAKKKNTKK